MDVIHTEDIDVMRKYILYSGFSSQEKLAPPAWTSLIKAAGLRRTQH
jgi:hypothetical protein